MGQLSQSLQLRSSSGSGDDGSLGIFAIILAILALIRGCH